MKANANDGFQYRWAGRRKKLLRKNLVSLGVFHEVNMDGHEKLSSQALKMGPVSIPIYGIRDKWSGALLRLVCVPNARYAVAIGHIYLDFVEEFGGMQDILYCPNAKLTRSLAIPIQITVDKGSETGDMYAMHCTLR